jgi:hypothetical protein
MPERPASAGGYGRRSSRYEEDDDDYDRRGRGIHGGHDGWFGDPARLC